MSALSPYLRLENVNFSYKLQEQTVPALRGISLDVKQGEMVAIQGPSGSGKSTLLYLLGCMLKPDSGRIIVMGQDIGELSEVELAYFRNRKIGFVFQQFHLLPGTSVLGNILLPTIYPLEDPLPPGESPADLEKRATELATRLGLGQRLDHGPQQLSGGQQQRVAIARALIRDAPLILADEPTGNLDSKTSTEILQLLRELNREGKTVVIITHDPEVAAACDRVIWVRDGKVQGQQETTPAAALEPQEEMHLRRLNWWTLIRESAPRAWHNLQRNALRSFLTMLGVVVGVASVLSMLTLGSFTKEKILQSYATLGVNTLVFQAYPNWRLRAVDQPANRFSSLNLARDVFPLTSVFPEVKRFSPLYESYNHSAVYGGRSVENEVSVMGVNEDAFPITRRQLAMGSPIRSFHVKNQSSVCVIGFGLAQRLFQRRNPLGETLQIAVEESTFSCKVIGVSKPERGRSRRGDPDMQVYVPYTYFATLPIYWWYQQLHNLLIEVNPTHDVETAGQKVQGFFEHKYGKSGDFRASSDSVLVAQMKRFLNLFTLLLVSIAALSLLVGGMGITNMMLVSVSERFREIGLRKAMGASDSAIRQLFFAESLLLCGAAGVIGVVIGFVSYQTLIFLGSKFIKDLQFEWVFNPWAFGISLAAILITGVLSGLGPALRAEKLQVIEALRSE